MNESDRAQWVNNDESLYKWWKSTGLSMRGFCRTHKEALDQHIAKARKGGCVDQQMRPVPYDPAKTIRL